MINYLMFTTKVNCCDYPIENILLIIDVIVGHD
jgi:hypothetical protein